MQIVGRSHRWSPYLRILGKDLSPLSKVSNFQYDLRSSRSTADLLTVASDRIAKAFNRSGATRAVALDISKTFDKGLAYWSYFFFSQFDSLGWFWMGNLHKNIQLMLEFLMSPSLVLHFSYYTLMAFLMMFVIYNIGIYADDTTLYFKCDQASDL